MPEKGKNNKRGRNERKKNKESDILERSLLCTCKASAEVGSHLYYLIYLLLNFINTSPLQRYNSNCIKVLRG